MSQVALRASRGWHWYLRAWQIFKRDPGVWILIGITHTAINGALTLVTGVGALAVIVFAPLFSAGIYRGVEASEAGQRLNFKTLFVGFREERAGDLALTSILSVVGGFVALVAGVVFTVLAFAFDYREVISFFQSANPIGDPLLPGIVARTFAIATAVAAIYSVVAMAAWFAPQVVLFETKTVGDAFRKSFELVLRHFLAILIFSLASFFWILVGFLTLGLSFLVLVPIFHIVPYFAYREMTAKQGHK